MLIINLSTEEHESDDHENDMRVELQQRIFLEVDSASEFEYPIDGECYDTEDDQLTQEQRESQEAGYES